MGTCVLLLALALTPRLLSSAQVTSDPALLKPSLWSAACGWTWTQRRHPPLINFQARSPRLKDKCQKLQKLLTGAKHFVQVNFNFFYLTTAMLEPSLIYHCKTTHVIFIFDCSNMWVLHHLLALKVGLDDKVMCAVKHVSLPVCNFFLWTKPFLSDAEVLSV